MRRLRITSVVAALLVVASPAWAGWSSEGESEPDTAYDLGWVWPVPPAAGETSLVYFNGFAGAWAGTPTSANPNQVAGMRAQPVPFAPSALLGVWVDCNHDGYIGHADLAALEYSSMLLPSGHPCPATGGSGTLSHNDGDWVQEFFPIGYDDVRTREDENPFHISDQGARVWADWGAPGAAPQPECGDVPLPRGTLRSTGAMVALVDCRLGHEGLATFDAAAHALGLDALAFDDAPREHPERSASPLNVHNPWGHEWDGSMVRAVDCDGPMAKVGVSDPTDDGDGEGELHSVTVPVLDFTFNATDSDGRFVNASLRPLAPAIDPTGSPSGTINETQAEASDCDRTDEDSALTYEGERRGSDGAGPYVLETSSDPVVAGEPRRRTDFAFAFEEGARGPGPLAGLLGARWQLDAGTGAVGSIGTWVATSRSTQDPVLSRDGLGAAPVAVITFYAAVSQSVQETLGLRFAAPASLYGTDCEVYECDADLWWRNADGALTMPRDARLGGDPQNPALPAEAAATELGVRTGQPFVARDTDCYDASVARAREAGVHWGALSATAC